MRILLVEDDDRIRNDLDSLLVRNSFAVDAVATLNEAYAKIADSEYDLIILDWMLPDGDGKGGAGRNEQRQQARHPERRPTVPQESQ